MSRRQSFTDRRRAMLARKVDRLDRLESRSMITESLGLMIMGIGVQPMALMATRRSAPERGEARIPRSPTLSVAIDEVPIHAWRNAPAGEGGTSAVQASVTA